jgi:hypothetical protein
MGKRSTRGPELTVARRRLDVNRLIVNDIVWLAKDVPVYPVERVFDLAVLDRLRRACGTRIGWAAAFMKAHAIVAREMPVLRSWYVPGWRPRIATASESVASLSINREVDGVDTLYWARFQSPDQMPLEALQAAIARHQTASVEDLFKRQHELGLLPRWMRRLVLRWNRDSAAVKRATRLGTFSISTLAGVGAFNRMHPSPLTTSLAYGPLDGSGHCLVTLLCDHRLLDGVPAARALERLEAVLRGEIAGELERLRTAVAAA